MNKNGEVLSYLIEENLLKKSLKKLNVLLVFSYKLHRLDRFLFFMLEKYANNIVTIIEVRIIHKWLYTAQAGYSVFFVQMPLGKPFLLSPYKHNSQKVFGCNR